MPDFANLTGVGIAGLAVFLFYKISSNHIDHNTQMLQELKEAISKLTEFLENHK